MAHCRTTVLCVDLDGTLILSDTLLESIILLVRSKPWMVYRFPVWLLRGKAYAKEQLALLCMPDPRMLPYRQEMLTYLRHEKEYGRHLTLITAANHRIADSVATHVGLFDDVVGSTENINMVGKTKLRVLREKYGEHQWTYAGNSTADIPVWEGSKDAIVVGSKRLVERVASMVPIEYSVITQTSVCQNVFRATRPHQWLKNVLLFIPIFTSHRFTTTIIVKGLIAFWAFCLSASAGYILNDLLDIETDRLHLRKRHRVIVAGTLSIGSAVATFLVLVGSSVVLAYALSPLFLAIVLTYLFSTIVYSLYIKRIMMLDVIVLSMLYTLRIIAGTIATGVPYSAWLIAFSLFIFTSLALLKRYSELIHLETKNAIVAAGRGYLLHDSSVLSQLGIATGCLSVFVLALYVNSSDVVPLYRHPRLLWFICPMLLYFIGRAWILAHRRKLYDDPIIFALEDPVNIFLWIAILCIVLASMYSPI